MHHVAFEVDDIRSAVGELVELGAEVIDSEPRPGLGGHEVAFVHPDSIQGVLAEMVGHAG
jgi:methylmalonyl-CoA/ethylmalonyl-CoA epimerase